MFSFELGRRLSVDLGWKNHVFVRTGVGGWGSISFRFVSFCFVSFRFVSFRFVFFVFSFRFVSFCFVVARKSIKNGR